jgi:hypothetical protein
MKSLLEEKFENWPEPFKPPFAEIETIGCCPEHETEGDFEWYRKSVWQDLRDSYFSTEKISVEKLLAEISEAEDVSDLTIRSLDPKVHRYYMKGVLTAMARAVAAEDAGAPLAGWEDDSLFYGAWDCICHDEKDLKNLEVWDGKNSEYSKTEVRDIIELIEQISRVRMHNPKVSEKHKQELKFTMAYWEKYIEKFE